MKISNQQKVQLFDALGTSWTQVLPVKTITKILRLYSAADISRRTNKLAPSINYHVQLGHVPGPSVKINKRWYWTAEDARELEDYLTGPRRYMSRSRYTANDIADMKQMSKSGVSQWEIARKFGATQSAVSRYVNGRKYNSKRHAVASVQYDNRDAPKTENAPSVL